MWLWFVVAFGLASCLWASRWLFAGEKVDETVSELAKQFGQDRVKVYADEWVDERV
jgi:hypothetical protein